MMRSWYQSWQGNLVKYTEVSEVALAGEYFVVGSSEGGVTYELEDGSHIMHITQNDGCDGQLIRVEEIDNPTSLDVLAYAFQKISQMML